MKNWILSRADFAGCGALSKSVSIAAAFNCFTFAMMTYPGWVRMWPRELGRVLATRASLFAVHPPNSNGPSVAGDLNREGRPNAGMEEPCWMACLTVRRSPDRIWSEGELRNSADATIVVNG